MAQISNPTGGFRYILLMEEILHQLKGSLSHHLQGFIHPRWLFGISSINSILYLSPCAEFLFFTLDFKVLSFMIVPLVGFPGWEWAIFLEVAGGQVDPSSMTNETLVEKTPDLEKYDLTVYTWGNSSTKKSFGVLFLKKSEKTPRPNIPSEILLICSFVKLVITNFDGHRSHALYIYTHSSNHNLVTS